MSKNPMEKEKIIIEPMTFGSRRTFLRQCCSSWKLKAVSLAFSLLLGSSTICASDWTVKAQTVGESETIIDTIAATLDHLRDTFLNIQTIKTSKILSPFKKVCYS